MQENITGSAVIQHLAKTRSRMVARGLRVPPPLRRGGGSRITTGTNLTRTLPSGNGSSTTRGTATKQSGSAANKSGVATKKSSAAANKSSTAGVKRSAPDDKVKGGESDSDSESDSDYGEPVAKGPKCTGKKKRPQKKKVKHEDTDFEDDDGDFSEDDDTKEKKDEVVAAGAPFLTLENDDVVNGLANDKTEDKPRLIVSLNTRTDGRTRVKREIPKKQRGSDSDDGEETEDSDASEGSSTPTPTARSSKDNTNINRDSSDEEIEDTDASEGSNPPTPPARSRKDKANFSVNANPNTNTNVNANANANANFASSPLMYSPFISRAGINDSGLANSPAFNTFSPDLNGIAQPGFGSLQSDNSTLVHPNTFSGFGQTSLGADYDAHLGQGRYGNMAYTDSHNVGQDSLGNMAYTNSHNVSQGPFGNIAYIDGSNDGEGSYENMVYTGGHNVGPGSYGSTAYPNDHSYGNHNGVNTFENQSLTYGGMPDNRTVANNSGFGYGPQGAYTPSINLSSHSPVPSAYQPANATQGQTVGGLTNPGYNAGAWVDGQASYTNMPNQEWSPDFFEDAYNGS